MPPDTARQAAGHLIEVHAAGRFHGVPVIRHFTEVQASVHVGRGHRTDRRRGATHDHG